MSATRIVVQPEIPGKEAPATTSGKPPAEQEAGANLNKPEQSQQTPERPQWLPEKFKSPEDLAKAYAELEKKQGQGQQQQQPEQPKKAGEQPAKEGAQPKPDQADGGFEPFFKEYAEKGQLSEESYAALAKKGVTKEQVALYIKGAQAEQSAAELAVFDSVGGKDVYVEATQWAAKNLSEGEVSAFNSLLQTGTVEQISLAARGLVMQYKAAAGTAGSRVRGSTSGNAGVSPFRSSAEVVQAMSDPRYKTDEAYRQEVMARLQGSTAL